MDLGAIQVEPRLRNPWQAIDLGFSLARAWWRPLFLSWFLPVLVIWSCLTLLMPASPGWVILIVWWLKPLLDRLPLFFASRAMFGENLTVRSLFKHWRQALKFEWFKWLTFRRFNFNRSLDMPVTLLEQLSGQRRNRRLQVLHQTSTSTGVWLTTVLFHVEQIIIMGVMGCILMFVPMESFPGLFSFISDQPLWFSYLITVSWLLAMAIVAPFYTMAGFSLYINRRVQLEGWDIEIRFRHLLERYQKLQQKIKAKV